MAKQKQAPRIVLDTSCVRGTPRRALQLLKDRGFEIHVSGLALSELAVHLAKWPSEDELDQHRKLRGRMRFLVELSGGVVLLAPTHAALVDKLGGRMLGIAELPFVPWLNHARSAWDELAKGDASTAPSIFSRSTAEYVEQTGEDFTETMRATALLGEPSADDLAMTAVLSKLSPPVLDHIQLPHPMSSAERFDAYTRILIRHSTRAYPRSAGQLRRATANDAIDTNLLQHLAEGLLVVTRDYELIEEVDATESPQAPWVRTVGELLLGRYPAGLPFGYGALVAKRKHRARKREQLLRFDSEGTSLAHRESE